MSPTLTARPARCGVDLIDAIYDRRSTRAFTTRAVEPALIHTLLGAAVQAPSAINEQPWAFVVVQDAALLRGFSDRAKVLTLASVQPGTALWERRAMLQDPAHNVFFDASTLIVICSRPGWWHVNEDCCLAAQNLMLAAHGLGLATCPIGLAREALNEPEAKRALSIPADHAVVLPIIVGYPRERPAPPPRNDPRILSWK